jgi:hypothetical protein
LSFNKGGFNDLNIFHRPVAFAGSHRSYTIYYLYTFYNLAKHGLFLVERRRTAKGFIYLAMSVGDLIAV